MKANTILLSLCVALFSCTQKADKSLKRAFEAHFFVGAALGKWFFEEENAPCRALVKWQFNTISPENMLKWGPFNPKPGRYNYGPVDKYVQFGKKHDMYVVGHVLFWQNQTPDWVFEDSTGRMLSRKALLQRMAERVQLVADRYGDSIHAWDVVNEAMLDGGELRSSPWTQILGADYIEQGFRVADSLFSNDVELLYNDFNMTKKGKRDAVVAMIRDFEVVGLRIDGVGMQAHWQLEEPPIDDIERSIVAFHRAGVDVHITELDIDVLPPVEGMFGDANGEAIRDRVAPDRRNDPYREGLPQDVQEKLSERYAAIFRLFLKHSDKIKRVTFWGITDGKTWLNNWPIRGRTNYPLLFDREGKPKPAFYRVHEQVK